MNSIVKPIVDRISDDLGKKLLTDEYTMNLWEIYSTGKKVSPQVIIETSLRAEKGTPISRPFGSPQRFSAWDKLLFNPVHLKTLPTPTNIDVNTSTIIGPEATKPLKLGIPIIISGMSYGGALSKKSKIALAKASTLANTASNSGEAPLLKEEREAAERFILQYNRGGWATDINDLKQADMIEIQLGQGAQAGAPMRTSAKQIDSEMRKIYKLNEGEDAVIYSRLPNVNNSNDFIALVNELHSKLDIPIGLKIAATNYLEEELEIAIQAEIDFITIDGASGGTHGGPTILQDDMGLPTLPALIRTVEYLEEKGIRDKLSILIAGGLLTPGHFLKALALGADAIYIGTIAILALVHTEGIKATPWEPPTSLVLNTGKLKEDLDVDKAAQNLANFLKSSVTEMKLATMAMGKRDFNELNKEDLCSNDKELAERIGIDWVFNRKH
jgi:methylamine---glutamate N-methyltransferase subunit C